MARVGSIQERSTKGRGKVEEDALWKVLWKEAEDQGHAQWLRRHNAILEPEEAPRG